MENDTSSDRNHPPYRLSDCEVISLPKISDSRGNLTFIEQKGHIPFEIRRVYYLYDIPIGEVRGKHAHIELEQVIISINGSFDVVLDDGFESKSFPLTSPDKGLYVAPGLWRVMENFSEDAVVLVLASHLYDEGDYIRDYEEFKERAKKMGETDE